MKNARSASPRENSSSVMEEEGGSVSGEGVGGEGGSEDGRITMTVGGRREDNEEEMGEVESDSCVRGCQQAMFFSVGEVRRRLSHHVSAPRKTFHRDPEDPSGTQPIFLSSALLLYSVSHLHYIEGHEFKRLQGHDYSVKPLSLSWYKNVSTTCSFHVFTINICAHNSSLVASSMKEPWEEKVKRVKKNSPYRHLPNWSIPNT